MWLLDSKEDLEVASEITEKEMLPIYHKLPINSGYRAGIYLSVMWGIFI